MQINQYIFGSIKNSDIYKNTRSFIPISKFDSFSEQSLFIKLISIGFKPKKLPRDITETPDYDIGNGYVVECTNYHGYFQATRIEETLKRLEEPGFEFFTQSDYVNDKIVLYDLTKRKIPGDTTIVRYRDNEWNHKDKIKRKIELKYGQCHDYDKRIINLNFVNEPFNPQELYKVILSILREFESNYQNLVAIMVGMKYPPFSQFLFYFIVKNEDCPYYLPKEFKKISRFPRSNYLVVPIEYFFNFGEDSHVTLRPPHKF